MFDHLLWIYHILFFISLSKNTLNNKIGDSSLRTTSFKQPIQKLHPFFIILIFFKTIIKLKIRFKIPQQIRNSLSANIREYFQSQGEYGWDCTIAIFSISAIELLYSADSHKLLAVFDTFLELSVKGGNKFYCLGCASCFVDFEACGTGWVKSGH